MESVIIKPHYLTIQQFKFNLMILLLTFSSRVCSIHGLSRVSDVISSNVVDHNSRSNTMNR